MSEAVKIEHSDLFTTYTYKGHPSHPDGKFNVPRISSALAKHLQDHWDLTEMDVRERAEFLYGLSKLLETMMDIGEVEHSNDWDWYVGIKTRSGRWHGDEMMTGVENFCCDTFTVQKPGAVSDFNFKDYYNNLEVQLEIFGDVDWPPPVTLKVGDIVEIVINER